MLYTTHSVATRNMQYRRTVCALREGRITSNTAFHTWDTVHHAYADTDLTEGNDIPWFCEDSAGRLRQLQLVCFVRANCTRMILAESSTYQMPRMTGNPEVSRSSSTVCIPVKIHDFLEQPTILGSRLAIQVADILCARCFSG